VDLRDPSGDHVGGGGDHAEIFVHHCISCGTLESLRAHGTRVCGGIALGAQSDRDSRETGGQDHRRDAHGSYRLRGFPGGGDECPYRRFHLVSPAVPPERVVAEGQGGAHPSRDHQDVEIGDGDVGDGPDPAPCESRGLLQNVSCRSRAAGEVADGDGLLHVRRGEGHVEAGLVERQHCADALVNLRSIPVATA